MARVSGNVLGNLSGKLGNLSARTLEGQTILAARPSSFEVSQSEASIAARAKFAVTGTLAKHIMDIAVLALVWAKSKLPGMSVYNTLFKKNYPFTASDKPTTDNIITPGGFALPVSAATLSATSLALEIDGLDNGMVVTSDDIDLTIAALVVYFNPIDPEDEDYKIIKLSKDEAGFDFSADYVGSINLNVVQQAIAAKYQTIFFI